MSEQPVLYCPLASKFEPGGLGEESHELLASVLVNLVRR